MTNFRIVAILLTIGFCLDGVAVAAQDEDPIQLPMSLSGLSVSQTYEVEDGNPLDLNQEALVRLLYRAAKVSRQSFDRFSEYSKGVSISDVVENSRKYRFWVFDLSGRAKRATRLKVTDSDPESSLDDCYLVELVTASGEDIQAVALKIPKAWLVGSSMNEATRFSGFYFGTVAAVSAPPNGNLPPTPQPLFIVDRIKWLPDRVDSELGVGPAQVLLAQHGVDIGLLDEVRKQNTRPLSSADSASFFEILSASRDIELHELPPASADFVELMQNPTQHFGDSVTVRGHVRRCVSIQIENQALASQLGFDSYYELDLFVPLGEQRILVRNGPESTIEYRHRFPVTVCVAKLGEGVEIDDVEDQVVDIDGFFYRFWKYKSEFTDREGESGGQVSPLIIGLSPTIVSLPGPGLDRLLTYCLIGFFVGGVALFWFLRPRPGQKHHSSSSILGKSLPDRPDFSDIGPDAD